MFPDQPLELNGDYQYALDLLEKSDKSVFITGRAGTGKSTLLQLFRKSTKKKIVVVAPTGIAALNVQGQTIHSFFGFPPRMITKHDIKKRRKRYLYQRMEVLIIDEISMVRADMLDNMDHFLRINRENAIEPFGGVQVIFIGDLFQLPPVVASDQEAMMMQMYYETPYFFSANVFKELKYETIELRKVYRQKNRHFLRLLDAVRLNRMDYDDMEDLNERFLGEDFEPEEFHITLSGRNETANRINASKLAELESEEYRYLGEVTGDYSSRTYPTEMELKLKIGAKVMFVKNDPQRRFVNGTLGEIVDLDFEKVMVEIVTPEGKIKTLDLEKEAWEIIKYDAPEQEKGEIKSRVIGTFTQYPIRLAWAITIHKSQGKTFEKVIIHLGKGAFEHGQTYVALSRCTSLQGIVLKQKIRPRDILIDERIVQYYETNF